MIRTSNAGPAPRLRRYIHPARATGLRVVPVDGRAALARALTGDSPVLLLRATGGVPPVRAAELLRTFDAVLGATLDGGWWAFGVRRPAAAAALATMTPHWRDSGALTLAALRLDLRVAMLPTLREPIAA